MSSDSENEHETPMYDTTNIEADTFRKVLSAWKQKQLDKIIGDDQNTLALNTYLKRAAKAYTAIKEYIEENKKAEIDAELVSALGDPMEFSTDTRVNILHTLFRDLVEFPFTYDTILINSFDHKEALDTNIIGNK